MKNITPQNGVSLVELLIATAISLFLVISLFTVYLSNKKTYQYNQSLSYLQENARLAFQVLTHDMHMARTITYLPTENALQFTILTDDTKVDFSKDHKMQLDKLQTIQYFVAKDKINKKPISVLYRKDMNSTNTPSGLIDNADNITWLFYTKDHPTHEHKATEIHDWSKVIGVKIILALSSEDQQLHRELNMVIALRNPLS